MQYNDFSNSPNDQEIKINLTFQTISHNILSSNDPIKKLPIKITVNKYDTIHSLYTIINSQKENNTDELHFKKYTFLYNGNVLNPNSALSFSFFGIKNNDTISVIEEYLPNTDSLTSTKNRQLKNLSFTDFCKRKGKFLEQGRLRDVLLSRIEGNLICYRKYVYRFEQMAGNEKDYKKNRSNTVVEESQEAPSTHMLPQTWSEENTMFPKN
ncbi:hypothetical protein M9Y10_008354 [Tritrichomonas musculus]|uniref:Ubiquitin-like domain-containing protein n=1 Tax=Tritrichomonas musculus TaxID=1915356 RepID=A0ABR2IZP5_9EUKA